MFDSRPILGDAELADALCKPRLLVITERIQVIPEPVMAAADSVILMELRRQSLKLTRPRKHVSSLGRHWTQYELATGSKLPVFVFIGREYSFYPESHAFSLQIDLL